MMTWSLVFSLNGSSAHDKTAIYAGYRFHVLKEVGLEFSVVSNKAFNDFVIDLLYIYIYIYIYILIYIIITNERLITAV